MCSNEGAFVPGSTHTGTILNHRRYERPVSSTISHHCYSSNSHCGTIVIRTPSNIEKTPINNDSRSSTKRESENPYFFFEITRIRK